MKPVTLWYRYDPEKEIWNYNHLEYGHSTETAPAPNCDYQRRAWKNGIWRKEHTNMNKQNVVQENV